MIGYKKWFLLCLAAFFSAALPFGAQAQTKVEKIHVVSKSAKTGYLSEASLNEKGNIELVFNIKSGKDKTVYEIYEFDKGLNFIGSKEVSEWKTRYAERPNKDYNYVYATVGGGTSFTILSTKLNLYNRQVTLIWDAEKQRYKRKFVKQEELKPRNTENRTFNGNVAYENADGSLLILGSSIKTDKKDKSISYSLLKVGTNLDLQEFPITFDRPHILTYSMLVPKGDTEIEQEEEVVSNHEMLFVFAPMEGNLKEYTVVQMNSDGKVSHRFTVATPTPVMAITAHTTAADGSIFLCALSADEKTSFDDIIGEYAPMVNPSYEGSANYRMQKFEKHMADTKFKHMNILKIKDGKLQWISNTPIADFKTKLKTPPSQKNGYSYDGKEFEVRDFYAMPDGGFVITGQVRVSLFKSPPLNIEYKDVVCLRIDSKGNLISQFSYEPSCLSDGKSAIFEIPQELTASADGRYLYWTNYEVKGVKGFASFSDAYNGVATFYANYYPAIGKIDLQTNTISNIDVMGEGNFLLNRRNAYIELPNEKSIVYVGEDKKGSIMLAKYTFE